MAEKRLIHAVAGSGKTRAIIEDLDENKRNLLITYTTANQQVLKSRIIQKFGKIPENTHVFGVFEFLYRFCLVPYSSRKLSGIDFNYDKKGDHRPKKFNGTRIISNQISNYILNDEKIDYLSRLNKFFDCIYIDECQDFASYEFDWLISLVNLQCKVWIVGDFFQKTFSTSQCGNKGKGIHSNFDRWKKELKKFTWDDSSLSTSFRCPIDVCNFVKDKLGIQIFAHQEQYLTGEIKFIENKQEIDLIMKNDEIIKLFYQKSNNYALNGQNWGECKGMEFDNVCVVLNNKTLNHYNKDELFNLEPLTKNRFYVACTRTKGNLYFVDEKKLAAYKKK